MHGVKASCRICPVPHKTEASSIRQDRHLGVLAVGGMIGRFSECVSRHLPHRWPLALSRGKSVRSREFGLVWRT